MAEVVARRVGAVFGEFLAEPKIRRTVQAGNEAVHDSLRYQIQTGNSGEHRGIEKALQHGKSCLPWHRHSGLCGFLLFHTIANCRPWQTPHRPEFLCPLSL